MIRILVFILFFIFLTPSGRSQETISETPIKLKTINSKKPIVFIDNALNSHFLVEEGLNISYFIISGSGNLIKQKSFEKPPEFFQVLQGYSFNKKNQLSLYFSNYQGTAFFKIQINDDRFQTFQYPISFDLDESFLTSINHKNKFYVLTYSKKSSQLKKYSFEKELPLASTIDLNQHVFLNKQYQPTVLGKILDPNDFSLINTNESVSLSLASKTFKLYLEDEFLILTLDHRNDGTRFLKFSLETFESKFLFFENQNHPKSANEEIKQSNSFYDQSQLHRLNLTNNSLSLDTYNTDNIELINSHYGNTEGGIQFTNSPFWEEGEEKGLQLFKGRENSSRQNLENEKKFLKKLNSGKLGLWGIKKNGILKMVIGGVKNIVIIAPNSNTLFISSNSYYSPLNPGGYTFDSSLNSIYFQAQFENSTMNHKPHISSRNVLRRAKMKLRYLKNTVLKNRMNLETIFKKEDYYVLGYYDKKEKLYTLMKFEY